MPDLFDSIPCCPGNKEGGVCGSLTFGTIAGAAGLYGYYWEVELCSACSPTNEYLSLDNPAVVSCNGTRNTVMLVLGILMTVYNLSAFLSVSGSVRPPPPPQTLKTPFARAPSKPFFLLPRGRSQAFHSAGSVRPAPATLTCVPGCASRRRGTSRATG